MGVESRRNDNLARMGSVRQKNANSQTKSVRAFANRLGLMRLFF